MDRRNSEIVHLGGNLNTQLSVCKDKAISQWDGVTAAAGVRVEMLLLRLNRESVSQACRMSFLCQ